MNWLDDGHVMHLELRKAEVVVSQVDCPEVGECESDRGCVVRWFLGRFGLECNVGVAEAASSFRVAWVLVGDRRDIDACQVWVTPVDDAVFAALHDEG